MIPESPRRTFLGKLTSLLSRTEVYLRTDGFEIDDRSLISLRRSWILFDEVLLVTLHPARAWASAVLLGFFGLIFLVMALILQFAEETEVMASSIAFGLTTLLLGAGLLCLVRPVWTVSIQGQRGRATLSGLSRRRMLDLYDETVRQVVAGRSQPTPPATPLESPPPPPTLAPEPA